MTPDTERNVATVRRFMAAAGPERRAERSNLLHQDFVVHEAGGLPFSGDYYGATGFLELMARMNDELDLTPGPIAIDPLGDHAVVARFRLEFTSRASGANVEMGIIEVYTLRDGRIAELDVFYKNPAAVSALLAE